MLLFYIVLLSVLAYCPFTSAAPVATTTLAVTDKPGRTLVVDSTPVCIRQIRVENPSVQNVDMTVATRCIGTYGLTLSTNTFNVSLTTPVIRNEKSNSHSHDPRVIGTITPRTVPTITPVAAAVGRRQASSPACIGGHCTTNAFSRRLFASPTTAIAEGDRSGQLDEDRRAVDATSGTGVLVPPARITKEIQATV